MELKNKKPRYSWIWRPVSISAQKPGEFLKEIWASLILCEDQIRPLSGDRKHLPRELFPLNLGVVICSG